MAPKKIDQATVVILDVGRNVSNPDEKNTKSFFSEARECTSRIIERKIMSQSNHLLGIILMGTKKTNNPMAERCPGAFKHIYLLNELDVPSWKMIRELPETPSHSRGDWFDALIVAADHFRIVSKLEYNIQERKIILMTNFQYPANIDESDMDRALNGLKEENIEIDVIGPDIYAEDQKTEDFNLARSFVEATNGVTVTFDYAMRYLLFHKKKLTNGRPWNIDLSIGPHIKIPVSVYIRIKDEPAVTKWSKAIKNPVTSKASSTEAIVRSKVFVDNENQTVVENPNLIKGYQYGQRVVPVSDFDKPMLYVSGDKCLSVYGFTEANKVTWQCFNGDALFYVFSRKGDKKAQLALRCLVECLNELKLYGIVRRVYNNGNAPRMFALMPVIDTNNFMCLSMASICFKEEIKPMAFPTTSLKQYACSDKQVNAFKDLIKAMDLTKAYNDTYDDAEAFPIGETVSPSVQYIMDCIAYRAMNPGKPLPQPRDDIMMLFNVPPLIEKRSKEPLEIIKNLFTLKKVEPKPSRRKAAVQTVSDIKQNSSNDLSNDIPKVKLPDIKTEEVHIIGTKDPIKDFKILKDTGKSIDELSLQMVEVIENLIYFNIDGNYGKGLETMAFYRGECVNSNPAPYNTWLVKFKADLAERRKEEVMTLIAEKRLGLILKEENELSTYTEDSHEDSEIYDKNTIPKSAELTISSEINNMFDEM